MGMLRSISLVINNWNNGIGTGVEKNLYTAKQWYLKAADQGLESAKEAVRRIEKEAVLPER